MKIANEDFREILFLNENSELLARITDECVIESDGVRVVMVKSDSKTETLFQDNGRDEKITVLFASIELPEA